MTFASSLRNAYSFEQADSLEGLLIDDAANQATAEYFEQLEHGQTIPPSLSRFSGLVVVRNSLEVLNFAPDLSEWDKSGFTDSITLSATGLARVALLPQHTALSHALDALYSDQMDPEDTAATDQAIFNAVTSTAERRADESGAMNVYLDWSSQFPLLDRIQHAVDRPTPSYTNLEYRRGYMEGLQLWPAVVGAYALGEELREQFGDIDFDPDEL